MNGIALPKPIKKVKTPKPLKRSAIKRRTKPVKATKSKKVTLSQAKKKTWAAFSLYIRLRNADSEGYTTCVTCGTKRHYTEMQAGHFIPGRHNAVLFSEDGVQVQDYHCNIGLKGNWPKYYEYMLKMYGQEIINDLIRESHEVVKYTISDLLELETYYKNKTKEDRNWVENDKLYKGI